MKKTLVALAVMVAAGSAQAIELYNEGGVTVDLHGDVEFRYKQAIGKDKDLKQEINDADLKIDTRYAVNDDLSIGAYFEMQADDSAGDGSVRQGDTYVGFYTKDFGSIKFGDLCTTLDDAGVSTDHLFGINSFVDEFSPFCTMQTVRYDLSKGMFFFTGAFTQDRDGDTLGHDGTHADMKIGVNLEAGVTLTGYYGATDYDNNGNALVKEIADVDYNIDGAEATFYAFEASYSGIENLYLSLGYYNHEDDYIVRGTDIETDTVAASAAYTFNKVTVSAGYSTTDSDAASDEVDAWYANASYGLAPNTTIYAEIGDTDAPETDLGYGFGIKAVF